MLFIRQIKAGRGKGRRFSSYFPFVEKNPVQTKLYRRDEAKWKRETREKGGLIEMIFLWLFPHDFIIKCLRWDDEIEFPSVEWDNRKRANLTRFSFMTVNALWWIDVMDERASLEVREKARDSCVSAGVRKTVCHDSTLWPFGTTSSSLCQFSLVVLAHGARTSPNLIKNCIKMQIHMFEVGACGRFIVFSIWKMLGKREN